MKAFMANLDKDKVEGTVTALANLNTQAKEAAVNASDFQKRVELMKDLWTPVIDGFKEMSLVLITGWYDVGVEIGKGAKIVWQSWVDVFNFPEAIARWKKIFIGLGTWFVDYWRTVGSDLYMILIQPFVDFGIWVAEGISNIAFAIAAPFLTIWKFLSDGWAASIGFLVSIWNKVVEFGKGLWFGFGEWFGKLITGIGNFWAGVWQGMKDFGLDIYNWILARFNDVLNFANVVIRAWNNTVGKIGMGIPEIGFRFTPATMGASPMPSAPSPIGLPPVGGATGGGNQIIVPIIIGGKTIKEIVIDALTGAVREREGAG